MPLVIVALTIDPRHDQHLHQPVHDQGERSHMVGQESGPTYSTLHNRPHHHHHHRHRPLPRRRRHRHHHLSNSGEQITTNTTNDNTFTSSSSSNNNNNDHDHDHDHHHHHHHGLFSKALSTFRRTLSEAKNTCTKLKAYIYLMH